MIAAILLLQTAAAVPTVGDTIWLARSVAVPDGHTVRPPHDSLTGAVELLGPPQVIPQAGGVLIRYPAVAWEPGRHAVALPGPVLVGPDGVADSVPPFEVTVTVRSVLPRVRQDSLLPVQPATGLVARRQTSAVPLLMALAVAALLLAPLHWWWRRRGPDVAADSAPPPPAGVPFARWADAGEQRAVLAAAAAVLRTVITSAVPEARPGLDTTALLAVLAEHGPALPLSEIEAVLRELDATRFAPSAVGDAAEVARRAAALAERIAEVPA
jgi:hypothetical protein